ncbi:hypothetical protein G9Q38_03005 [Pusillimonas sp. DMV24BSW_D]|uniref:LPS translocon maturation chaperone LptM n=1 Tax=Neopusillimonas aestuarii TaxID=2716226 RepID=UPI000DF484F6|nr:lipoprotein [Pusillimonas sp. DMV24BSW_D]QIM47670.1 hypothetical protein G9Q38_03005 [Pusillimonas sp. DMV24BSW_D]
MRASLKQAPTLTSLTRIVASIALLWGVAACGYKGPLTQPPPAPPDSSLTTPPAPPDNMSEGPSTR